MKIDVLTLFPEAYAALNTGIIGRALEKKLFEVDIHNIRDYSQDKHKKCDDYPYGGGAGMVMTPQPVYDAIHSIDPEHKAIRIYLSPRGRLLNQQKVLKLSGYDNILLLSGSYEGIDQRAIDLTVDEEISVGDYILTSGDIPALILINAVARYIPGVLGSGDSVISESFNDGLLEYPQYTRPYEFMGLTVPEVLISGNHKLIEEWRTAEQLKATKFRRPDLLEK
ncbi:MAG: tRNA (guanosine(37)-N1)-methyltransferase TrmD [Christensenellales bacterium]|jgi:tRNA (guanine37-N1)-methyltransferase